MTNSDLEYLKAELAMAQQSRQQKLMVNVSDLISILHKYDKLKKATVSLPKPCGFIIGDHLRNLCDGSAMFAKIKRKPSPSHSTQLFFLEIDGEDTRESRKAGGGE